MHHLGPDLSEGDVLLTNHPAAGGSHLPDLTVITPVSGILSTCVHHFIRCRGGLGPSPNLDIQAFLYIQPTVCMACCCNGLVIGRGDDC